MKISLSLFSRDDTLSPSFNKLLQLLLLAAPALTQNTRGRSEFLGLPMVMEIGNGKSNATNTRTP